jgi:nuclear RNA export factor
VVFVKKELAERMIRINGNLFAGVHVTVEPYDGSSTAALDRDLATSNGTSAATADTKSKMMTILSKRYFPETKLLDLSKLGTDEGLQAMGIFNSTSTESKFFPALMKVWEMQFTSSTQRREAVESVSLADNQLANITVVTTLAQTVPDLKNLDLTNNNFKDASSMSGWRWKFRNLEFLDLTGNPISAVPTFKDTMLKWYPKLRILNNVEVRTAEEIAAQKKTPIPVQAPYFQDESQIAENFIRAFFVSYDNNRAELVKGVYDNESTFSMNINTQAPKAQQTETAGWDAYIKKSRNLLKISHLPPRMSRIYTGAEKILELWNELPQTRHPDMTTHADDYLIECHQMPGLPDPSGQSPTGVGGLIIMVHGKYEESVGGKVETRSFDRTFIIGPGGGVGGIRVINDILCLRAYGGNEAWSPESQAIPQAIHQATAPPAAATPSPVPAAPVAQLGLPAGYGAPAPGKTDTQVQQEQLVAQMSAKSGMTLQFSEMALSGNGWNPDAAWKNFEELKVNFPQQTCVITVRC